MLAKEMAVPEGVNVSVEGNKVKVSGQKGELQKILKGTNDVKVEAKDKKVKVFSESERKEERAMIGTTLAHIRNMIDGVTKGFTYKLKVIYSHFPVTVKVEGDKVSIQNFLGEKTARVAKIVGKSQVKVSGQDIEVTGIDLEDVSQTAANLEQATRIVARDRRIFQDGIFITSKGE